ncbi:hypothetical protein BDV06DRAFT_182407 [Aspergillus oleicola]
MPSMHRRQLMHQSPSSPRTSSALSSRCLRAGPPTSVQAVGLGNDIGGGTRNTGLSRTHTDAPSPKYGIHRKEFLLLMRRLEEHFKGWAQFYADDVNKIAKATRHLSEGIVVKWTLNQLSLADTRTWSELCLAELQYP